MTMEVQASVKAADVVHVVIPDPMTTAAIGHLNPNVDDMSQLYVEGAHRVRIYEQMRDRVLASLEKDLETCFLVYGHPLVFAYPTKLALEAAHALGYETKVLAGISAEDLLYAELEIDPAQHGCQTYAATAFLKEGRSWDLDAVLLLWQVGMLGEPRHVRDKDRSLRPDLTTMLVQKYGPHHPVYLYEGSFTPFLKPRIERIELRDFTEATVGEACTVMIPPRHYPVIVPEHLITIGEADSRPAPSPAE